METLRVLFLEKPAALLIGLAFVELTLLFLLYLRRTRGLLIAALVPPVLAAGVATLAWAVTTERERLEYAMREATAALQAQQWDRLAGWIDADYDDGQRQGQDVLRLAQRIVRYVDLRDVRLSVIKSDLQPPRAIVTVSAVATTGHYGRVVSRWRLHWVQGPDRQWRLRQAVLEHPPGYTGLRGF